MHRLWLVFALALVAAAPCSPDVPPIGSWTQPGGYGPVPARSIQLEGATIVVGDFTGDRAFTTTTARYDAKTMQLQSVTEHASCCGDEWSAGVMRTAAGAYEISTARLSPGPNGMQKANAHDSIAIPRGSVVVTGMALVPWLHHAAPERAIEQLLLPGPTIEAAGSEPLDILPVDGDARPSGVSARDRALRVVRRSGASVVLWYDPCTFVLDDVVY
jgi:hypothetical protein